MPCKIEIRKKIESSVEQLTDSTTALNLKSANEVAKEVNDSFGVKVVEFVMVGDVIDKSISIPESLIQTYFDSELEMEKQEAARLLKEEEEKERKYVESKKEEWEENREYFENDEPFTRASDANTQDTLFGLNEENKNLEFNITTLNAVSNFLQNIGVEKTFIPSFLNRDGSIIKGAIASANFIKGTVDISENERTNILNDSSLTDEEKSVKISEFWKKVNSKLPEEASHFWYRLLSTNSELKKALWLSSQTAEKNNELYGTKYGKLEGINTPEDLTEESIGQLIAESIKRIEQKNANVSDYSFFKKFLEWINSVIDMFNSTEQDPFEVAAMKILSSDMSDLMTWEEYSKLNNIINFADVLTNQSVAPIDYTLISDIGYRTSDGDGEYYWVDLSGDRTKNSPYFNSQEELDMWVFANIKEHDQRQKEILNEVRDNQAFFDRLLNKSFRKKSRFLPKTLRKYFEIIDTQNLSPLKQWNISQELQKITKKLSEEEKKQLIETNGYTNIAPTLKVLPDLLKKYKKNPIVLSEPIKIDSAKKQELSILNGIKEMIKLENPSLKSITAEQFVAEAHNWLETNYLLGFASETGVNGEISSGHPGYNVPSTFVYYDKNRNISETDLENYRNLTEQQIRNLSAEERQMYLDIAGIGNRKYDIYHNKISIRFNNVSHFAKNVSQPHFRKRSDSGEDIIPSAFGSLTYFYTGKNKWKDAVLLHEIQNDNIEFLRNYINEKVDLETSLGRYLQQLNTDLISNIEQIESGGKRIQKYYSFIQPKQHIKLNTQLQRLVNLPVGQGLNNLKQSLNESIQLYKSDSSNNPETAQDKLDKAYSERRKFIDLQNKGGIKSLLTKEQLAELSYLLKQLNTEEIEVDSWDNENNTYYPDLRVRNLAEKKEEFNKRSSVIVSEINAKLEKMYGKEFPNIALFAPTKARTKTQRRNFERRSDILNENVNSLLAINEININKNLSKNIEFAKKDYVHARNAFVGNNFNEKLVKITQEQYNNLIENYKYNEDLLKKLIDEQAQKDLKKETINISKLSDAEIIKDITGEFEEPNEIDGTAGRGFKYKNMYLSLASTTKEEAVQEIRDRINPDKQKSAQQYNYDYLKKSALDKKEELEKNYGKIEEEVKQTLEVEMNYFTPLIHHLIQKHILQYGKNFPMYFSGFNVTKLTQQNDRTAMIYAGKDEINIVDRNVFKFNEGEYTTNEEIKDIEGFDNSKDQYFKNDVEITQQEYKKAYQQATERKAKEIKYTAAIELGLLEDNVKLSDTTSDKELEEGIKKLNEFKKQSTQNLDRVINTIINLSDGKPIETGKIYNDMSQIPGVKLIWQNSIPGLKGSPVNPSNSMQPYQFIVKRGEFQQAGSFNTQEEAEEFIRNHSTNFGYSINDYEIVDIKKEVPGGTGGYLVDLSDYNYNAPVLFGLDLNEEKPNIKPGVEELFDSNPELANVVYETLGFKQPLIQDDNSYYRGQYDEPETDEDGNLYLTSREDSLYKKAGLESYGVSMSENLEHADEYGIAKNEIERNILEEESGYDRDSWDNQAKDAEIYENGYWVIQIDKDVTNKVIREDGEVKLLGKVKIPKGKWKIENRNSNGDVKVKIQITPQQKQQALQQYSQYLDTIFPNSKVKDIVYHGSDSKLEKFSKVGAGTHFGTLKSAKERRNKAIMPSILNIDNPVLFKDILDANVLKAADKFLKENKEYLEYGYRNEESGLLVYLYTQGKIDSDTLWDALYSNRDAMMQILQDALGSNGYKYVNQVEDKGSTSYVVFEPEQMHILGSQKDIKGFKEFVGESTQTVESYRAQEQAELSQRIPNIENYKVNGKVDKSLITDENDLETYNEIYDKYDALITPLLEASEESEEQVENTDSLEELLDNEKLDFQDAILIDLINKVAPNQKSLPTTEEVVEELPSQQSIDSQKQNNSYSDLVSTIKGLMNTLGIKIVKAEAIYLKQQEINALYNKLASSKSDIEKQSIQKQIDELKREGVRKNVLGLADTLNGVINLALSENNIDESEFALNEEMLHFIVDIIEQKYPDLYKELLQKVGTYNLYNQMYGVYASQKEYQNEDGSVNVNKIKKEAVAKVLNDFLSNPEYSEEDYQLSKTQNLWNKIKDTLKSFFEQKANNVAANNFRFTLDKLLNDPNFITKEDAKLLSGEEFFGIMGTISSWAGNKMIGKESAFSIKNDVSFGEYVKNMLEQKKNVSKTYVDKNTGKITSPTEPNSIERYVVKTLEGMVIVRSRVSDFVTKFLEKIFPNSSSKNNKELELGLERGLIVHNIFEFTFAKYVDPDTGIVRKQPINSSPQLETYEKKYAKDGELSMPEKIDKYVKELIALYPNSYFLIEIPIFNKSLTVGGTIDLMIVEPNKKVHIYDWKTKKADVHKGQGIIQKREKIDPWNIKAWRIQLDSYMDILKNNYGVESFGKIRMIPIMTEFETNGTTISNINIGSESNPDIRQRQLLAVPSKQELTGLSETDKLIKANYGLAEKLQNKANKVSDISEKERLRLQSSVLEDLAIDLQVGKGIQSLVNKLEQILKIHDDIIEKNRNGEIKGSDLPIIASAIVDLSIYASDNRLVNVSEELFSRFSNLTDLQKETKKELENISIKVSSKIEELKKVLINSAEIFGNDQNVYDINKIENEIENSPGILGFSNILAQKNSIYQLNFKTGQLFSNLVRGVQNQIERERSDVRRTLEKIKTNYLKDFGGIFKSDESVFSILFRYPTEQEIKEGAVDGPKLVAKIDKKFYTTLKEQKEKFVNLVNASIKLKKDFTKTSGYTELVKWLEDNTDFEAWRKNYIERKEKQKNLLETQYSYIVDEYEKNYTIEQALNSWEYRYNILKSPAALNSNNISAFINEDKWLSADYKKIKSSPSALAAYNAFREIMFNARRVGYIQDLSQISEIPTNITTKNKLAYYYSLVKLHGSLKYLYFNSIPEVLNNMLLKPLESNLALDDIKNGFNNINPVTQEEELELPIYMLRDFNAQVGKDGRLKSLKDLDLFKVYEELAFHVINFQNLSATEELADALIMVEQGKTLEKQMNAQGNTNEKNIKNKETKTREDILKHAKNFIYYNKTKEKDKTTVFNFSRNKLIEYWKAFTTSLYLAFNHALAFKAFNASTLSTISNAGYTYSKRDVLFSPLRRALTSSLIEKSFNYHVSSSNLYENRLKNNNYAKRAAVFGKEYLLNSLTVVDYEVQKNIFYAILPNFTIIEENGVKKIVNIDKYVDDKYPNIFKETPEKRKEIFKKKNEEKEKLRKNNLSIQLKEKAKKEAKEGHISLDLSDIDAKSIDSFTNKIQEESKRILGNMSDKDIYLWKTGNLMSLITQFKGFAFKIVDVRYGGIKYNSALERWTYGKYRALGNFLSSNQQIIDENNQEVLKTKLAIGSSIVRFLTIAAPFLNIKENEQIIQVLKIKYLQYATDAKNKNETVMSEKEYMDMYLTELTSAKNELYVLSVFIGLLAFGGGDDDKDDPFWLKYIKNIIKGSQKELLFTASPKQLSSMVVMGFPGLGSLTAVFNAISFQFGNVLEFNDDWTNLFVKVDPFKYTVGERLSPIIKATPFVRPTSALLAQYSADWRKFLNVDKKSRSLVKNRIK